MPEQILFVEADPEPEVRPQIAVEVQAADAPSAASQGTTATRAAGTGAATAARSNRVRKLHPRRSARSARSCAPVRSTGQSPCRDLRECLLYQFALPSGNTYRSTENGSALSEQVVRDAMGCRRSASASGHAETVQGNCTPRSGVLSKRCRRGLNMSARWIPRPGLRYNKVSGGG